MIDIHKKLNLLGNGVLSFTEEKTNLTNISDDKVRVKPINVGVCSSDIPRCFDSKAYSYPLIIGHEFLVQIINDPLNKFKKGERCAVFPLRPCFRCSSCFSKEYNRCSNYSYYGSRVDGGMQSILDVDRWNLVPLPKKLDDISGSLIEPVAVCKHASEYAEKSIKILLFGGGFLSQILSKIFISKDKNITCVDRNNYKKDFFSKDIDFCLNTSNLKDSSFDLTYECSGAPIALEECIRLTKPLGDIVQLANPDKSTNLSSNLLSRFMRKEQKLVGTWNSRFRPDDLKNCDWNKSIEMLVNDEISIKELISHTSNLEDSHHLIEKIYLRRQDKGKLPKFNKAIISIS